MKLLKKGFKILLLVVIIIAFYLGGVILYGSITDYHPEEKVDLQIIGSGENKIDPADTLTFLSWNIGFCGLGAEMDFFYDGGKMVHPSDKLVEKYTKGVTEFLEQNRTIDFIFLQEVDYNSWRTNGQNEVEIIGKHMPGYSFTYADNYRVGYVPVPLTKPFGKVRMGQMNLSKAVPVSSVRRAYFAEYPWPKRLFMLDRCFIVSRFALGNGKQLVLMNTHNSAYDAGGKMRNAEMPVIRDLMLEEYKKGNYVIAGGDWNQNPPGYKLAEVDKTYPGVNREKMDRSLFPEEWKIVYDHSTPTNREIDTPLQKGKTESTIIDFYIASPNVEVIGIKTHNLNFENSDHNPVFLKVAFL